MPSTLGIVASHATPPPPLWITAETGVVDSLNNYPVQITGSVSTTATDKVYGALSVGFPGTTTSYISLTGAKLRQWSDQPAYTLQCWVKISSYNSPYNYSELIKHSNLVGFLAWSFGPLNDGTLRLQYWDGGSNQYYTSSTTVPLNIWTHIGFTRDQNTIRVYINGSQVATGLIPGNVQAGTPPLVVGHNVPCLIDDFRIIPGRAQIDYVPRPIVNGSFEEGSIASSGSITGWTASKTRVRLNGLSTIGGHPTPADPTNNPYNNTTNDAFASTGGSFLSYVALESTPANLRPGTTGTRALALGCSGTSLAYGITRGPYIISQSAVTVQAGDQLSFWWRALGGTSNDAYDVFAYLLNVSTGSTIICLDRNDNTNTPTSWTQVTKTIASGEEGSYKFVFIAGSYDSNGSTTYGAALQIDDVEFIPRSS